MKFLMTRLGQKPDLGTWETRPFLAGTERGPHSNDPRDAHERIVAREAPGDPEPDGPFRRLAEAIGSYEIFPRWLLTPVLRRTPVQAGDTIGGVYHGFGVVDMFFASRVIARFDGPEGNLWRAGFTYRTLDGHPELGEETFCVEKDRLTGEVRVALRAWSRPGHWLTRLAAPVARRIQLHAGRAALDQLEAVAHLAGRGELTTAAQ